MQEKIPNISRKCKLLFQMRCAVRATGCVIGDLGFAVRAQTRLRCRCRFRSELVDLANHQEDDKSENQKIQYGINEAAVSEHRRTSLFCCLQCSIFLAVEADKQIGKIHLAKRHT